MNQHQALANLHKVVQICNSGINLNKNSINSLVPLNKYNTIQHVETDGVNSKDPPPVNLRLNEDS